ncbi:hypothetical protein [Paraburkholderia tagetis]|uniref:Uncharacterized protein n=1 Tax=Paraburkholderia tagetis TaxID=2913261 RepID=A0A9X1UMS9_9BURK|nr:hypothetical protein [Paraburkholderia tagetis]MCG5077992.1 hypothetical protein [Paraburkholderia tagetis]
MDDQLLHNRPFDEITIGESASLARTAQRNDIDLFAAVGLFGAARRIPHSRTGLSSSRPSRGDGSSRRFVQSSGKGESCLYRNSGKAAIPSWTSR